ESGTLFHKNHMLYPAVGYVAYRGLQLMGFAGRAIVVLQTINAVCGALAIGFAYAAYKRATRAPLPAIVGVVFLGSSFSYWLFSPGASYITVAAVCASASMAVLLDEPSPWRGLMAGILTALSILTWQASVFLIPALSLVSFQMRPDTSKQTRTRQIAAYVGT